MRSLRPANRRRRSGAPRKHCARSDPATDAPGLSAAFAPDGETAVVGRRVRGRATIREAFESFKDYKAQSEETATADYNRAQRNRRTR